MDTVRKVSMKRNILISILTTDTPIYLIWYDASCSIHYFFLLLMDKWLVRGKKKQSAYLSNGTNLDLNNRMPSVTIELMYVVFCDIIDMVILWEMGGCKFVIVLNIALRRYYWSSCARCLSQTCLSSSGSQA